ncbi:MAG: gamma-glutamyl-gamma-aminobutyrate hydrolase family protein [Bacillota bacterium]|nr:gamma-glutamyl-gamma-aminobutyrate hydrolase family protein [Bacillota bacterium]
MLPLIGITSSTDENDRVRVPAGYPAAVEAAGGVPVILPVLNPGKAAEVLAHLQGLLLSGGVDLDPSYYGEDPLPGLGKVTPERDAFELALARQALALGVPILGICRGVQVLNVAAGGNLFQDLGSQLQKVLKHSQEAPRWHESHPVQLDPQSRMAAVLGVTEARVNSFHHQAVRAVAPGLRAVAWAPDGVIEGVESTDHRFALGVQWHPEEMWSRDPLHLKPFSALVEAARARL